MDKKELQEILLRTQQAQLLTNTDLEKAKKDLRVLNEKNASLTSEVEKQKKEISDQNKHIDNLSDMIETLKTELKNKDVHIENLGEIEKNLRDSLEQCRQDLEKHVSLLDRSETERTILTNSYEQQLKEIKDSTTFKLSQSFASIFGSVKKTFKGR